jgi:predicted RNA methylase
MIPSPSQSPTLHAGRLLLGQLERSQKLNADIVRAAMEQAFDGTDADGRWTWKTAYDAGEAAAVLFLMKYGRALLAKTGSSSAMLPFVDRLASMFMTHTRRSEESVQLQQFSTPMGLGLAVGVAAAATAQDVVLEPSAGTGLLAVHAALAGARLVLNELADDRAGMLRHLFPTAMVTQHDAAHIDDFLDRDISPSLVLMNPPFTMTAAGTRSADVAFRHMRSALNRLCEGGRLVAIVGNNQGPENPEWVEAYQALQDRCTVVFSAGIDGSLYARHGTTFPTRLIVIDKVAAADPSQLVRSAGMADSVTTLIQWLAQLPRRPTCCPAMGEARPSSLSAPVSQSRKHAPRPTAPIDPEGSRLHYDLVGSKATTPPRADAIYEPYVLQSIAIPGALDHPDQLVQSAAMAAMAPPRPSYQPLILPGMLASGRPSAPQFETVVYAGEAHSRHLAGWWSVSDTWDRLTAASAGAEGAVRFRRGFFLGDGTGCGKGVQAASIILDNWLRGRRRAVWISRSDTLIEDARRDWSALGMERLLVTPQWQFRAGTEIRLDEGILFTTFATLRTERTGQKSRLEQLVDWCGHDFDGVIIVDEAHSLQNAVVDEEAERSASQQGRAGLRLQHALADARIVYVSATGGTTVQHFGYCQRLGLWGSDDFPFATREAFMTAIDMGGVAAMEVLARDLRALGLYTARSLSFDGVEYQPLLHQLSPEQIRVYDSYADAFSIIHANLDQALEAAGVLRDGKSLNRRALASARSAFESTKQRFFSHLLLGMAVLSLIAAMEEDLREGRSPIVQIVSTGEALTERRLADIPPDQWNDLDIDITPREYVLDYLLHSFPTQLYIEQAAEGDDTVMVPAFKDGQPVTCREAEARRDDMITRLGALPPVPGALDQLVQHFGTDTLAEVTGRRRRVVRHGRKLAVENRPGTANLAEAAAFMDGRKQALIFSDAGGTGRSYHADLGAKNQRRRVHYLLEPGWRADNAIQGLGRSHRTNQRCPPIFRPVSTDVAAQKRFISTIARRLDSMGALTRGQRQTGGQGLFSAADNLESCYARDALRHFYRQVAAGQVDGCPLAVFETATGLRLTDSNGLKDELPALHTFLNRLLALRISMQNLLFNLFSELLSARVEAAIAGGTYDLGLEILTAESFVVKSRRTIHVHEGSGAETQLLTISQRQRIQVRSMDDVRTWLQNDECSMVVNQISGRAAILTPTASLLAPDGTMTERVKLLRPAAADYLDKAHFAESSWRPATQDEFLALWQKEIGTLPETQTSDLHIVTGLLLPIWRKLPSDVMRVFRLTTDDGEQVIGRQVSPAWVHQHQPQAVEVEPDQAWADLRAGTVSLVLSDGHQLRRARQMGAPRLELTGWSDHDLASLKALGLTTEIVSWSTRLFLPFDQRDVFDRLVERHPIVTMEDARRAA